MESHSHLLPTSSSVSDNTIAMRTLHAFGWPLLLVCAGTTVSCGEDDQTSSSWGGGSGVDASHPDATSADSEVNDSRLPDSMIVVDAQSNDTWSEGTQIMTPVRAIPNLVSMTFWESTSNPTPDAYTFLVDGPELSARLDDPLTDTNRDIKGAPTEFYDVYYSEADGTFNLDGSYLTISGVYSYGLPQGGGLNLAEIGLNFSGTSTEYGNYVASYVALGDNKDESSVNLCIDGNLQTCTTMGNTIGTNERLRLTLGFLSSSGPPPPK